MACVATILVESSLLKLCLSDTVSLPSAVEYNVSTLDSTSVCALSS